MRCFLQAGADQGVDLYGMTPMDVAAEHGYHEVARYLLQANAETGKADDDGRTVLPSHKRQRVE